MSELEDLVSAHPLRESGWALLVTTLFRAGRQGDALAACARVRGLLAEELGVDPGPRLRLLEEQVLRQDPALTVPAPRAAPTRTAAAGSPTGTCPRHPARSSGARTTSSGSRCSCRSGGSSP